MELPGDIVFDGVMQRFFTRVSYCSVMAAVALDAYSGRETTCLLAEHGHPGPWNAKWGPTPTQFEAYLAAVRQDVSPTALLSLKVGTNL